MLFEILLIVAPKCPSYVPLFEHFVSTFVQEPDHVLEDTSQIFDCTSSAEMSKRVANMSPWGSGRSRSQSFAKSKGFVPASLQLEVALTQFELHRRTYESFASCTPV